MTAHHDFKTISVKVAGHVGIDEEKIYPIINIKEQYEFKKSIKSSTGITGRE